MSSANTSTQYRAAKARVQDSPDALRRSMLEALEPRLLLSDGAELSELAAAWGLGDWAYRREVVIDHARVAGNLSDFAVLLQFTHADLAQHAQGDADDIVFTAADGATRLKHEIESYDSETGSLVAWVRLPSLTNVQDTTLYVYYGNPQAASQADPPAVWDGSFLAVQHLEETTGAAGDSTSHDNDGAALNGVVRDVAGQIDGADGFDGVNDRITLPQVFTSQTQFTVEGWLRSGAVQGYALAQRDTASHGVFLQYYPAGSRYELYVGSTRLTAAASVNQWHYVVGMFDGTTARLFVDGQQASSATATLSWPDLAMLLGDRATGGRAFSGPMDEVRLSDVARGSAYVVTNYANQLAPTAFAAFGPQEGNEAPVISAELPANGATGVSVGLAELSFELTRPGGAPMDYTVTTMPDIGSASGQDVADGRYTVPISGLAAGTTYTWEVWVDNGLQATRTFTFSTDQAATDWGFAEWRYRRGITVDHTKVAADLANFPIAIDLVDADLGAKAQVDGADILFASADGTTQLDHEIESFDPATGHLVAWVKLPLLSASQDTSLYLYYGNDDVEWLEPQENPEAVWDAGYLAVHHLEETSGNLLDSTAYGRNGTPINGVVLDAAGRLDGGDSFDGVDDRVNMGQVYVAQTQFTIEGWLYTSSKQGYAFSQRNTPGQGVFLQYYPATGSYQFYVGNVHVDVTATANAWHYVVATYDGTTARLYVDNRAPVPKTATLVWPNLDTIIGNNSTTFTRSFQGRMDEVRLSSISRSTAFIRTSYANQSSPSTFYSVGEKEISQNTIVISNPYPANGAQDVELDPVLEARIKEIDGNAFDWTVQLYAGGEWQVLDSGTDQVGQIDLAVPTDIDQYSTQFLWKVTAHLSNGANGQTEALYSFTTRGTGNYAPRVSSPSPADDARGVDLNPGLSAEVVDIDGDPMNISFAIQSGGQWRTLATYNNVPSGTYTADSDGWAALPLQEYLWRVRATDAGSGQTTEEICGFTTGGALTLKWQTQVDMSGAIEPQIQPVMGDVDDDGQQEIVFTAGDDLWVLNGATGAVEWVMEGGVRDRACELIDLNDDGTPEILVPMYGPRLRALRGDGTILWTSAKLSGEDMPMFPIIGYDIDGDGLPTLYFVSEDVTPDPYSGNPADYTGAVSMLDHNGNVLADTWVYHPCWGGMALGDVNFDGRFELYVSDRREGYHNTPANGLQAYDAHTLAPLWERPDLHHSSPLPILADVVGDEDLEVIAEKIVNKGPAVLNGLTGQSILDYTAFPGGLPTHGVGTVYDLDGDGNLELIMGTSYPMTAVCEFAVFDLVDGVVEFRPTFDYHVTWPPKLGDVTGDGQMDILATMGNQGDWGNYPLLIYNSQYELIDRIDVSGAGQLAPARVYDCDGDGLNEVVLAGVRGLILVYDTYAPTPNPAPRTWTQMYSEYRQGVAEYVEPPGPRAPAIQNASPADGAENVGLEPTLSFRAADFQRDLFDLTVELRIWAGGQWQWVTLATYNDQHNGTYTVDTEGYANAPSTAYLWRVTATDAQGHTMEKTFSFTTVAPSGWGLNDWQYRRAVTIDHTKVAGNLANFPVLIQLTDLHMGDHAQGDGDDIVFTADDGVTKLAHEFESYNPATGALVAWVKLPSLSNAQDTVLYLYYGNAQAADQSNPPGVWDVDFLAVQHLEETAGAAGDSTSHDNDGSALNGVVRDVAGKIDGADSFDGVNDRIALPQVFTNQTHFTIEGWLRSGAVQGYAIAQRDTASHGMFLQYYPAGSRYELYVGSTRLTGAASVNQWHYVVGTFDGTTARLYVDGQQTGSAAATLNWPALATLLGDRATGGRPFAGPMDEVRLSAAARGPAYVATSYANQNSPATFYTLGPREQAVTQPIITNPVPADEQEDVPADISQIQFNLLDLQGDTLEYTVTTSPDIGGASGTVAGSGTITVPLAGVVPFQTYTWQVDVTDGVEWAHRTFSFTTYDATEFLSDSTFDASADSADLRANSPGQDWFESRNDVTTLVVLDESDVDGNTAKKAKFIASASGNVYLSQEFRQPQTGQFSVQWDIYVDEILDITGSPDRGAWMFVGNDPGNGRGPGSSDSSRFVYMAFAKNGGGTGGSADLIAIDLAGNVVVLADLHLDRWYTIRVDLDVNLDRYSVSVDGDYKGTVSARRTQTSVAFVTFAQWNDGAGTFYVDNVHAGPSGEGAAASYSPPLVMQDALAMVAEAQPAAGADSLSVAALDAVTGLEDQGSSILSQAGDAGRKAYDLSRAERWWKKRKTGDSAIGFTQTEDVLGLLSADQ